jgi:hypothetical protein
MRGVAKMANDRSMLGTTVMDVLLHFNLADILDYLYFLFRLLQPNYSAMPYRLRDVLLT